MTVLRIFAEHDGKRALQEVDDRAEARRLLADVGVCFEQWQAQRPVLASDPPERVLEAYAPEIERLKARGGYVAVDVVSVTPDHPQKAAMREKFSSEHRHAEDEVRLFVEGRGLFSLHLGQRIYEVLCEQGDLLSVPAGTPHWFDMGSAPRFVAIRMFNRPEGWVAEYTGSDIASRFSRLD